jgi:hypothetical protein
LAPDQHAQPTTLDCAKGCFVGQVVAEIRSGMQLPVTRLFQKHPDRFAFVAARAKFEASLKIKQR